MKSKKGKFQKKCGWNGLVYSIFFFIGLTGLVLLTTGCGGSEQYDPRPNGDAHRSDIRYGPRGMILTRTK